MRTSAHTPQPAAIIASIVARRAPVERLRLATATEHHGSWWPQWIEWLIARSGTEKAAPSALGSRKYPPLGPAPGTYVHE